MLILTGKVSDVFYIGDDVTATIIGIQGNQVRLGFNAPDEVEIDREVVRMKKLRENGNVDKT